MKSVYCAVRTGSLNKAGYDFVVVFVILCYLIPVFWYISSDLHKPSDNVSMVRGELNVSSNYVFVVRSDRFCI